jgi:hypothetical protein
LALDVGQSLVNHLLLERVEVLLDHALVKANLRRRKACQTLRHTHGLAKSLSAGACGSAKGHLLTLLIHGAKASELALTQASGNFLRSLQVAHEGRFDFWVKLLS